MKKLVVCILTVVLSVELVGCNKSNNNMEANETTVQSNQDSLDSDSESSKKDANIMNSSNSVKATDQLLDAFINGTIGAKNSEDASNLIYITDLKMDAEEWDTYSIGERIDLDNDGDNELIIHGPYGGMYLDARNNEVYQFAIGEGTALSLSYVTYEDKIWILYSNNMNDGYSSFHMKKYDGADHLVDEMNFEKEVIDDNKPEAGSKYTLNNKEISSEEYEKLYQRIFD